MMESALGAILIIGVVFGIFIISYFIVTICCYLIKKIRDE